MDDLSSPAGLPPVHRDQLRPNARYRVWEAFTFLPFSKLKEPPHLKHVAAIPREVLSENVRQSETGAAINNKSQGTVANF